MTTTTAPALPAPADVDGYVQQLPSVQLTITELWREHARLGRERLTLPYGSPARADVTGRQQDRHAELRVRLAQLAVARGGELA